MKKQQGFTIIELIMIIILAVFVGGVFYVQTTDLAQRHQDASRKTDINAIYSYLEGVTFAQRGTYPLKLEAAALKGLDAENLKDPHGKGINDKDGDYTYLPTGCQNNLCTGYKLTATLVQEAPFSKTNSAH